MDDNALHLQVTDAIIGAAMEVHRELGPGLLETVYERAMTIELDLRQVPFDRQPPLPLFYKGYRLTEHRPDLIVDGNVIVEVKSVRCIEPVHVAQVLTYLKATGIRVGLILNFNTAVMKNGIRRVVL